jgi:hypothetical protein
LKSELALHLFLLLAIWALGSALGKILGRIESGGLYIPRPVTLCKRVWKKTGPLGDELDDHYSIRTCPVHLCNPILLLCCYLKSEKRAAGVILSRTTAAPLVGRLVH